MAVPKKKTSKSKRGMRRSHQALESNSFVENKKTGQLHRPHHVDLNTGTYRDRQVIDIKDDTEN
jgi:large subunit ribosomal protein L32